MNEEHTIEQVNKIIGELLEQRNCFREQLAVAVEALGKIKYPETANPNIIRIAQDALDEIADIGKRK